MTPQAIVAGLAALGLVLTPALFRSSHDHGDGPDCATVPLGYRTSIQAPDFEAGHAVAMQSAMSHSTLLAGGKREVYLCVNLLGAEQTESRPRPPLNLALVIDRSGSMASEQKLAFAKSAADQFVDRLGPDDNLAIITYDGDITTLVPSEPVRDKQRFHDAIATIRSGGATNLYGGMMAGYDELRDHMDPERMNRVVLLSDGLATAGVQDFGEITARAERCAEHGVRISTMGMGIHYDDVLMQSIAKRSGGNYSFVGHPEEVGAILANELDELGRVVARNATLTLVLGDDVELVGVLGYNFEQRGRVLTVKMPDLQSEELRKVILKLQIGGEGGSIKSIAQAKLSYQIAASLETVELVEPMNEVRFSSDYRTVEEGRNLEVLSQVEVSINGQAMIDAMGLQKQGSIDAAMELLDARHRQSDAWNRSTLRSLEVQRTLDRIAESREGIDRTRHDPDAGRFAQLGYGLEALGYIE